MSKKSPGPEWVVMSVTSSEDEASEEDELSTHTLKRKGLTSAPRASSKRRKMSLPERNGIDNSSERASKVPRLEGRENAAAGSSKPAVPLRLPVHEPGPSERAGTKHIAAGPSCRNKDKEQDDSATSPPASTSPPPQRPTLQMGNKDAQKRKGKRKELQPSGFLKPPLKSSVPKRAQPKPAALRSSPKVIEISSDDDSPPPPKPPPTKRGMSYKGPSSGIRISKNGARPALPTRKSLPTTVIVLDDSDEDVPITARPVASSSGTTRVPSNAAKHKKSRYQVMRDPSSSPDDRPKKSVVYITAKSSQALPVRVSSSSSMPAPAVSSLPPAPSRSATTAQSSDKMQVDVTAAMRPSTTKSVKDRVFGSRSEKRTGSNAYSPATSGSSIPSASSRSAITGLGVAKTIPASTSKAVLENALRRKRMSTSSDGSEDYGSPRPPAPRRPPTVVSAIDKSAADSTATMRPPTSGPSHSAPQDRFTKAMGSNGSSSAPGSPLPLPPAPRRLAIGARLADITAVDSTATMQPLASKSSEEPRQDRDAKRTGSNGDSSTKSSSSVPPLPRPNTAPGLAVDKAAVDGIAAAQSSTSKSPLGEAFQSRPAKLPQPLPLPLPLPKPRNLPQTTAVSSTKADTSAGSENPPPLKPRPPLPGRKRSSLSGPSRTVPVDSPAVVQEPKSPDSALHTKGEPVTPSRIPIPPSPSRRWSGMDMSGLEDVLDATVPLSSTKPRGPTLLGWKAPSLSETVPNMSIDSLFRPTASTSASMDSKGKQKSQAPPSSGSATKIPSLATTVTQARPSHSSSLALGSSMDQAIDLTLDDSDEEMAAPPPPPPPRPTDEGIKEAVESSLVLKRLLAGAKSSQVTSPYVSTSHDEMSRADTDELKLSPTKSTLPSPPVASPVLRPPPTTIPRPLPLPLPTPRPSQISRHPEQIPASASSMPSSKTPEVPEAPAAPEAPEAPEAPASPESPKQLLIPIETQDDQQHDSPIPERASSEESSGSSSSESSSSSGSSDGHVTPLPVILPHRSARKSTNRGRFRTLRGSGPVSSLAPRIAGIRPPSPSLAVAAESTTSLAAVTPPESLVEEPKPVTPEASAMSSSAAPPSLIEVPGPATPEASAIPSSAAPQHPEPLHDLIQPVDVEQPSPSAAGSPTFDSIMAEVMAEVLASGEVVMPEQDMIPAAVGPPAVPEQDDSDLEYVDEPLPILPVPEGANEDLADMMDVEDELLTSLAVVSNDSHIQEGSPDPLGASLVAEDVLEQPRRSTRSSRSSTSSDMPLRYLSDQSQLVTPAETPCPSPSPDPNMPVPIKMFGGFASLNWKTFRQNLDNFKPKCYFARDLPHKLQDTINRWPDIARQHRTLARVLQSAIQENTADDEPDAPFIEIINEVDEDPTPPWEFHYSNKMWHGEGVPPTDVKKLLSCNCMGKCDPKSKTCACLKRQQYYTSDVAGCPDFIYDSKQRLRALGYPIFECNDLCGCGDECRNRVVQHGRQIAVSIQKTAEKGWGVFAGNKKIQMGTFIGIYAGELLTDSEGEARGEKYNKFGRTYLFDLDCYHLKEDNPEWEIQYTVDAYHAGNFTRFLNHSCDPNCLLVPCYINESDIQKPLLVVFAKRDIEPLEELCFSYYGDKDGDDGDEEDDLISSPEDKAAVYAKCACKAPSCTGYMFR